LETRARELTDPPRSQVEPFGVSTVASRLESRAIPSRSPTQHLSREELEVLEKLAQQLIGSSMTVVRAGPLNRQEELADLVERGRELINAGKIHDARVLLRIAAEANDATAAFVLATTYDPRVLEKLKDRDSADIKTAQAWYQKASDLGSTEASDWLRAMGP